MDLTNALEETLSSSMTPKLNDLISSYKQRMGAYKTLSVTSASVMVGAITGILLLPSDTFTFKMVLASIALAAGVGEIISVSQMCKLPTEIVDYYNQDYE